jgi:hypothetical protein
LREVAVSHFGKVEGLGGLYVLTGEIGMVRPTALPALVSGAADVTAVAAELARETIRVIDEAT